MPYKNREDANASARRLYAKRKAEGTLVTYTPAKNVRHQDYMRRMRGAWGYWESRKYTLKSRYGITIEQFYGMLESQNHKCVICKTPLDLEIGHQKRAMGVVIDHCHKTNKIRGLLHRRCNSWLAPLEHDGGAWLKAAMEYLWR